MDSKRDLLILILHDVILTDCAEKNSVYGIL